MSKNGIYQWTYPSDWIAHISGDSLIVDNLSDFGSFNPGLIKASYTDVNGTSYEDSLWVRFSDVPWTPTDTGQQVMSDKITKSTQYLKVYPNPTNRVVTIISPVSCQKAKLTILDMQGRIMKKATMNGYRRQIDISHLPAGLYFIKLQTNQQLFTHKLSVTQ